MVSRIMTMEWNSGLLWTENKGETRKKQQAEAKKPLCNCLVLRYTVKMEIRQNQPKQHKDVRL